MRNAAAVSTSQYSVHMHCAQSKFIVKSPTRFDRLNWSIHMVEKCIGEIVIRTPNMQKMVAFYRDVIDLEPFKALGTMQFLKVSEGFGGRHKLLDYLNWVKCRTWMIRLLLVMMSAKRHSITLLLSLTTKTMTASSNEYRHSATNYGRWSIL